MKTLNEYADPNLVGYIICEEAFQAQPEVVSNNKDWIKIKSPLQDVDKVNRNKRMYRESVMEQAIQSPYVKERLATKTFFGECGHPVDPDIRRQMHIDQTRISHIVTEIGMLNKVVHGVIESANTMAGRDFKGLVEQGCKVAFSMRGVSPVVENKSDYVEVKGPLTIFSYDWVVHPSHSIAYMESIVRESTMNMLRNKDQKSVLTEDCLSLGAVRPILNTDVIKFVRDSSRRFRTVAEQFEIPKNCRITIDPDMRFVNFHEDGRIVKVAIERYVHREIDDFLSRS